MHSQRALLGIPLLAVIAAVLILAQPARPQLDENRFLGPALRIGALTVWPVLTTEPAKAADYLDLKQAQEAALVSIREHADATVGSVAVENKGCSPILIKAGTLLDGGKQDRQVIEDAIVEPEEVIEVDALCVEEDRWDGEEGFTVAESDAPAAIRARQSQEAVWDGVRRMGGKSGHNGNSLIGVLGEAEASRVAAIRAFLERHDSAVGFAYALHGRPAGIRVFADAHLFRNRRATVARTLAHEGAPVDYDDAPPVLSAAAMARLARAVRQAPTVREGAKILREDKTGRYQARPRRDGMRGAPEADQAADARGRRGGRRRRIPRTRARLSRRPDPRPRRDGRAGRPGRRRVHGAAGPGQRPVARRRPAPRRDRADAPTRRTVQWDDDAVAANTGATTDPITQPPLFSDGESAVAPAVEPMEQITAMESVPVEPPSLEQLLVDVRRELYRRSSDSAMPLRELLLVAAMSMVDDELVLDQSAIDALHDLTDDERALLAKLQDFFHELGTSLDGSTEAQASVVDAVTALKQTLNEMHLKLGAALLCTRVTGFGDFDEFTRNDEDRYAFLAHNDQSAIVYLEVDDFLSERNADGEWVTELAQQLTIYSDRDGIPVWRSDWQPAIDRSRKQRRDFFTVQLVNLPNALSVGRYQLKIRVRDERSGAETEGAIHFEMVADAKLAN